ncbi:MAG TPA: hypothetical protein VJU86_06520 [Pyrinomonadaceae bacterium]|nr:hypothetical protein [Pyrinomonadaceae bacterium]
MSRRNILLLRITVGGVLALSTFPALGQTVDSTPNTPQLVREAYRNGVTMSRRIYQYSWTDTRSYRVVEKGGKVKTYPEQVYEVFPNRVSGRFLLRQLVKENGVPLSPERFAKEQARLAKEIEKDDRDAEKAELKAAEKKSPPVTPDDGCLPEGYVTSYGANGGLIAFGISDFLCAGEFSNPRRGAVNGREATILDFRPRADYVPPNKERKPITGLHGSIWIDDADRVVSRLEAWPGLERDDRNTKEIQKELVLVYEQLRLADGTWMHASTRINTTNHPKLFNGVTIEFQEVFTNYKRFSSEVDSYKIGKP